MFTIYDVAPFSTFFPWMIMVGIGVIAFGLSVGLALLIRHYRNKDKEN